MNLDKIPLQSLPWLSSWPTRKHLAPSHSSLDSSRQWQCLSLYILLFVARAQPKGPPPSRTCRDPKGRPSHLNLVRGDSEWTRMQLAQIHSSLPVPSLPSTVGRFRQRRIAQGLSMPGARDYDFSPSSATQFWNEREGENKSFKYCIPLFIDI